MELKKAENKIAFGKVGIYGPSASGKTYTSAKIAIGLHQTFDLKKPIAMFDTEPAASFIIPLFEEAGIEFLVCDNTRSLEDLMAFVDKAEKDCSIAIVDSITHVWREAQKAYLDATNKKLRSQGRREIYSLEFHHWGPIKAQWGKFTERFLTSKLHMIVCGRAGTSYEYRENEQTSKMELITTGTKMATEKELAYEPSLLIEMVRKQINNELMIEAIVEKDRSNQINGKRFEFPSYDNFSPHFESLNIGGKHFETVNSGTSEGLFEGQTDGDGFANEKRQREIWADEIKSLLIDRGLGGQSADAKAIKGKIFFEVFNSRGWTAVESKPSVKLKEGFDKIETILNENDTIEKLKKRFELTNAKD